MYFHKVKTKRMKHLLLLVCVFIWMIFGLIDGSNFILVFNSTESKHEKAFKCSFCK